MIAVNSLQRGMQINAETEGEETVLLVERNECRDY